MKKIHILFALLVIVNIGCGKYLDINDDPYTPTEAELRKVLTGAQQEMAMAFAPGNYIGSSLSSYTFHLTIKEVDNFGLIPSYSSLGNTWLQSYVYALKNIDYVIDEGERGSNLTYAGIGKLMKAYMFTNLVDIFGDIPFSEFNKVDEIKSPKLDSSQDIYNGLFDLIDDGIADLLNTEDGLNELKPTADDLIYGGKVDKWVRMGNTLQLKLLVQSRKAKSEIVGWKEKLNSLLAKNDFLNVGEDFEFKHTSKDNPDERHPAYVDEYLGGQKTQFISPWLYEIMAGKDLNVKDNPFLNVQDPRMPYYWYNQITPKGKAENETDYRDGAFVSIFFASNSSYASSSQSKTQTCIGVYPCGGKFDYEDGDIGDNGLKPSVDEKVGNGVAPEKMLQAYSVPFLLAELYLTGEAEGNARNALKEGIERSIKHVNTVSQASDKEVPTIELKNDDGKDNFIDKILNLFDKANVDDKLKIVMTQKWIANFFNPVEAYTDMRRTGYPEILNSKFGNFAYSPYLPDVNGVVGPIEIPLLGINSFHRVLYYPTSEVTRNKNVTNIGKDIVKPVLFWDK